MEQFAEAAGDGARVLSESEISLVVEPAGVSVRF
jgi:hypothetical protein